MQRICHDCLAAKQFPKDDSGKGKTGKPQNGAHAKEVNVDEKEDSDDTTVRGAYAPPPYVSSQFLAACGNAEAAFHVHKARSCLLYTSPSPRDLSTSRMPSSA